MHQNDVNSRIGLVDFLSNIMWTSNAKIYVVWFGLAWFGFMA